MAFASVGSLLNGQHKTSADSWSTVTSAAALEAGNFGVIIIGIDNGSASSGANQATTLVSSVTLGGVAVTKIKEFTQCPFGTSQTGVTVWIGFIQPGSTIASGATLAISLAQAVTAKTVIGWEFSGASGGVITDVGVYDQNGAGSGQLSSLTISSLSVQEYLAVRASAREGACNVSGNTSSWTNIPEENTTGGGGTSNVGCAGEFRIQSASSFTSSQETSGTGNDHQSVLCALYLVPTFTGTSALTTSSQSLSASAEHDPPADPHEATAALVTSSQSLSAVGTVAPWVVAAAANVQSTLDTDHPVTIPSGSGGMLLALVGHSGGASNADFDLPGWTRLIEVVNGANVGGEVWYKFDSGDTDFTATSDVASKSVIRTLRIAGADPYSTPRLSSLTGTSSAPNPDVVVPLANWTRPYMVAAVAVANEGEAFSAYPSGYDTDQYTDDTGGTTAGEDLSLALATSRSTSPPETGVNPGAFTLAGSTQWLAFTVIVRGRGEPTATAALTTSSQSLSASAEFQQYEATAALTTSSQSLSASAEFQRYAATATLATSSQSLSASAEHDPPAFTATATLTTSSQSLSASAEHDVPTFTATATLATSAQSLSASAEFRRYAATAALTTSAQSLSASAEHDVPTFAATSALTTSSQSLSASAEHDVPTFAATSALTTSAQSLSADATFEAPANTFTATAALTAASQSLSASAEHDVPTFTATAALTTSAQSLSASAEHDVPTFAATAALTTSAQSLSASAEHDVPTFAATAALTTSTQSLAVSAEHDVPTFAATAALTTSTQSLAADALFDLGSPDRFAVGIVIQSSHTLSSVADYSSGQGRLTAWRVRIGGLRGGTSIDGDELSVTGVGSPSTQVPVVIDGDDATLTVGRIR